MRSLTILTASAAIAASFMATAATAQTAIFTGGGSSPSDGYTIINTFDNQNGLSGTNFHVQTGSNDQGASPAKSVPFGTSYLTVLGGGSAFYSLAGLRPTSIQFDWGSLDAYNTLTIGTTSGSFIYVPGTSDFPGTTDADGNQIQPDTNGLFTFTAGRGQRITGVTFASSANSFEADNFAIRGAVPEPATWAMMIMGFGMVGFGLRSRRRATTHVAFG